MHRVFFSGRQTDRLAGAVHCPENWQAVIGEPVVKEPEREGGPVRGAELQMQTELCNHAECLSLGADCAHTYMHASPQRVVFNCSSPRG